MGTLMFELMVKKIIAILHKLFLHNWPYELLLLFYLYLFETLQLFLPTFEDVHVIGCNMDILLQRN